MANDQATVGLAAFLNGAELKESFLCKYLKAENSAEERKTNPPYFEFTAPYFTDM